MFSAHFGINFNMISYFIKKDLQKFNNAQKVLFNTDFIIFTVFTRLMITFENSVRINLRADFI